MKAPATLAQRQSDLTQRAILDAALALLEEGTVPELTLRAVAARANISERTIFRYFATRDEFLDTVAAEVTRRIDPPAHPSSREELLAAPAALYARFEAEAALTRAALHSELYHRIRSDHARERWKAIRKVVDAVAPRKPERERKIAAANIRYFLAASTWHYYRSYFRFSLEETVECARTAIAQALDGLGPRRPTP